jgi:c-di-GMP-binding flagellar brake protein YcgR
MEQRRAKRFKLQLPLSIKRAGAERTTLQGRTRNISSGGVLFTTEAESDFSNGPIEYVITLNGEGAGAVNLRCIGKVLRLAPDDEGYDSSACQVAATLERYEFVRER